MALIWGVFGLWGVNRDGGMMAGVTWLEMKMLGVSDKG